MLTPATESSVVCILTRFGLRSPRHLLPTYLEYRRVIEEARATRTPGLLRAAFLIENPRVCYSLSIWAGMEAIPHFGTNVLRHVEAGNRIFGRLTFDPERGPELWSTKWRLIGVSEHNLNWPGLDLRGAAESLEP